MEPTVEVGDRILVDKLAFGVRLPIADRYLVSLAEPRPGDVVVPLSAIITETPAPSEFTEQGDR